MWHAVRFYHHACGQDGTIVGISVNAQGEMQIHGICIMCGMNFAWEINMAAFIAAAAVKDHELGVDSDEAETDNKPITGGNGEEK